MTDKIRLLCKIGRRMAVYIPVGNKAEGGPKVSPEWVSESTTLYWNIMECRMHSKCLMVDLESCMQSDHTMVMGKFSQTWHTVAGLMLHFFGRTSGLVLSSFLKGPEPPPAPS